MNPSRTWDLTRHFTLASALVLSGASPAAAALQRFDLGGGAALEMVSIPKGTFTMGSPESEPSRNADEAPREVTLTRDFFLSRSVVTVAQWKRFTAETGYRSEAETGTSGGFGWNGNALQQRRDFTWQNPGYPQTPDHPAVILTWDDTQPYLKWLTKKTGWTFSLPTEAQWEYACRAGTNNAWWSGPDPAAAAPAFVSRESSQNQARAVTTLRPNPWDLLIGGNVWEWCADFYGPYQTLATTDPFQASAPPTDKARRVLRGGSWLRPLKDTRSASRYRNDPKSRNADNGFRVLSFGHPPAKPLPPLEPADPAPGTPSSPIQNPSGNQAAPPASPATPPSHPSNGAPWPPGGTPQAKSGFPWLLSLLGFGFILFIVRRLRRPSLPPIPASRMQPDPEPAHPALPQGRPFTLTPGTFLTKPAPDGFWLNAGYAMGTWLNLSWNDGSGIQQRRIQYDPGNEGQFIYTGTAPEDVQVTPGDDSGDYSQGGIPPMPMPTDPDENSGFLSTIRDPHRESNREARRPPHRPSAY
ncbi:MAG: hypothetical protein JWL81_2334 [Verrucomicrobiales bacterium]|nr:hypothetical protein [Verrucomicrobiales bacterium]